ncbi:MAG: TolC family protein [Bacteroidota bacterium]
MRNIFSILLSVLIIGVAQGQSDQEKDTTTVLKFDDFYAIVLNNHPVVKQAELLTQQAAQELRMARGAFDPKLEASWSYKNFKDTNYYDLLDVSLKIPTWIAVDPKIGIKRNDGEFVSRENQIPGDRDFRQVVAGFALPVGKGLVIDERRATFRIAQLMQGMAEAEQIKEINKILLTAAKDYWEWYYAYNNYVLMQRSIALAQDIFDRTKLGFEYGEVAAIDTVQAKITLLNRVTEAQQANIERIRTSFQLSNHLWAPDGSPLEIRNNARPEEAPLFNIDGVILSQMVELAQENHPEIRKLDLKNESLLVERALARENLKPQLDVSYYLLDQPFRTPDETSAIDLSDNYQVGLDFSFPIFLRKERAKLTQTKNKILQNGFQRDFKEREIVNQINGQYNRVINTADILIQQQMMVDSYERIVEAEQLNLQNGESDLFKINVQIDKLIESQSKLFKMRSTYQKDVANLYWAAGVANLQPLVD